MKKTLFLTLSLVVAVGLLANNACQAKKIAPAPTEMHHAEPATHIQEVAPQQKKSKKASCEGASCYSMAGLTKWFNQTKNWVLGLFGIETAKKKAKRTKMNNCTTTCSTACDKTCANAEGCCPSNQ